MTDGNANSATRQKLSSRMGASRKLLERKAAERVGADLGGSALEDSFPSAGEVDLMKGSVAPLPETDDAVVALRPSCTEAAEHVTPHLSALPAPVQAPPAPLQSAAPMPPAQLPTWSAEDESAFQGLLARRKAAGYQRRGKDMSGQVIRAGDIKPNPNTVVAVIVGIVAEHGQVTRAKLISAMAETAFPHPKAQPADKGWCQGYVAGAIRNGFLALDDGAVAAAIEAG